MLNNINNTNPAFGANLRIATAVKDTARLENIKKAFAERTPEFKETLSVTRLGEDWNNMDYVHIGSNHEIDTGAFFKSSFSTLMENLSDNEIVTKLIKGLKGLKEAKKREYATLGFENERYRAEHEQKRNMLIANNSREKGDTLMASRFEYLANCFGKKIAKIDEENIRINNRFMERLNSIADGDEDILNFAKII